MKKIFTILLVRVLVRRFSRRVWLRIFLRPISFMPGKFSEAADNYQKLIKPAPLRPLAFNYGNAEFKSGHLGKAVAAYHQPRNCRRVTRNYAPILHLSAIKSRARRDAKAAGQMEWACSR